MASVEDKVFLLSRRWAHHANHSGYDILGRHIAKTLSAKPIPDIFLPNRLFWKMTKNMIGYDRTGAALEMMAAAHMTTRSGCIYHLLYGDNCFNYLGALNGWRNHRVIASFHLPPRRLAEWVRKPDQLQQLSAVIILGCNQLPFFEGILPRERIILVPYAVDTSFFTPPSKFSQREENLCLFVGSHLRDYETLSSVIENARILAPQLRFALVAHPKALANFNGVVGNFTLHSDIRESELLALYQKATLVIQPLQDAVANTALLEGMACGTPIVVTEIGAVREYVTENCACFVPPYNPEGMLEAILSLVNDPVRCRDMSNNARQEALKFDWSIVAGQMRKAYEQILALD